MKLIEPIRIIRKIKLKYLELFLLREGYYGKIISYMLFIDFNRPSTLSDFPYLKQFEDKNDFGRSNFIKVIFFANSILNDGMKQEVLSIAGGFLEDKEDCDWNADFEVIPNNNYDIDETLNYVDTFVKDKYDLRICLKNIPYSKFNNLSQD
ncbi:hypothetical protein [Clostridium kluyveri]|uniref:Uncharacterized protein n=1 Tax=Clostridium kluyveri TaxID=1534 RepID=A0A1L5F557_CLOKL|nr:hypothetical protein [Clostridium kluyveri]APM37980.1 hypothetical protein BS101_04145 [Clostridium kluyveri]